jgi:hypothetical protein
MANRYPLIYNPNANQLQELQSGDNLDLSSSGISSVGNINSTGIITATSFSGTFSGTSTLASGLTGSPSIVVNNLYTSGISTFTQNINLRDNVKANFGDGDDLRIYHDGSNSYVEDTGTGNLYLSGSTDVIIQHHSTGETMAKFTGNGASELYYDNSKKFETTSGGVSVTGSITASSATIAGNVSIAGTLTYEDVTNIDSVGLVTARTGVRITTGGLVVTAGVSTFTTGPVFIGSGTSTGTASQPLQVTGGAYVSGSVGINSTNPSSTLSVGGTITELYAGQYWNLVSQADVGIGASQVPLNQYLGQLAFVDDFSPTTLIAPRIQSVGEKTTLVSGNTASLTYNTGGGNIAICTNPSGNVTLAVTGIPTDSTFDNTSLTFSVFVNQTGTARSCTAVTLNGLTASIKWAGGSLASALSGVTTTSGTDIYSFTGINTIGSASTTANYLVLGVVNGGFR